MNRTCLCCGKPLKKDSTTLWHEACAERLFGTGSSRLTPFSSIDIEKWISEDLDKSVTVPGVQKKLSLSLHPYESKKRKTLVSPSLDFIVKTGDGDYAFLPEYENLTMCMADASGLPTVPHTLYPLKEGGYLYLAKRIDRSSENGKKVKFPMEDFCQLSGKLTEYKYSGSYERCGKDVIHKYSANVTLDCITFFKAIVFSYLVGNTDMHLKNFSLMDAGKGYRLTPFYDLVPAEIIVPQPEMALTVNGKNQKIRHNDFLLFAKKIGINENVAKAVISTLKNDLPQWEELIDGCFVSEAKKKEYKTFLKNRSEQI